jgi:hypothetical protein
MYFQETLNGRHFFLTVITADCLKRASIKAAKQMERPYSLISPIPYNLLPPFCIHAVITKTKAVKVGQKLYAIIVMGYDRVFVMP